VALAAQLVMAVLVAPLAVLVTHGACSCRCHSTSSYLLCCWHKLIAVVIG